MGTHAPPATATLTPQIQSNICRFLTFIKELTSGKMSNKKKTLVLGASDNPSRYSYLAIQRLRQLGHPVVAIGRKNCSVADVDIDTAQEPSTDVDTVTVYMSAKHQKEYYDYILSLHPKRIIFNPGAENDELADLARKENIKPMEACTLVLLSTGQY
jgi:predicted CoA-binding protein